MRAFEWTKMGLLWKSVLPDMTICGFTVIFGRVLPIMCVVLMARMYTSLEQSSHETLPGSHYLEWIGRCSKTAKDVAGQIAKEWELKAQKDKTGRLLSLEVQDHCSKSL